jgi:predicted HTH transcriptional regulator
MPDDAPYLARLVQSLRSQPHEATWLEFKTSNGDPEMVGKLLSALSNAAALDGRDTAYVVWGIEDATRNLVGTTFAPALAKKGSQELESWLVQMLAPRIDFSFRSAEVEGKPVVVMEISTAHDRPTAFRGVEWVRIGSVVKPLKDVPETERRLWRVFDKTPFERQLAMSDMPDADILRLIDHGAFFETMKKPPAVDAKTILETLEAEAVIQRNEAGRWNVTNLGAILFAKDLEAFPTVDRKAVRLIVYEGRGRTRTRREQTGKRGYAVGFEGLMDFLKALLPRNEVIGQAFRTETPMYPDLALRELIANALIHQDFSVTGAGPMVEVFDDRIEVTNPGAPLGDIQRLLDQPPRSRNEALARITWRIGLCEERGSGVDKVVEQTEIFQLPPPAWTVTNGFSTAVLFAHKALKDMDKDQRVHACYLHASLRWVMHEPMTNTTLRERFGIEPQNSAQASRIIKEALVAGLIKPFDLTQGKRNARYIPVWA